MKNLISCSRRGGAKTSSFARFVALALVAAASAATARAALPAEYQQLEYIQASGQCRIKTGVTPAYNDKVEMTWMPTTVSGNQNLWCARTATSKQFTGFMIGATFRFDRGDGTGGQKASATAFVANTRYSIVADYGAGVSTISNDVTRTQVTTVSNSTGSYEAGSALAIFASHNNNIDDGLNNWGSYRLYAFKLRNSGGTLRLDLVPAKRLSDNALGVYDMVNGDFLTNDKSGSFIAGPNVGNAYTWIGGASGNLSTAANWSPAPAGAFTAADELIVNGAAEITVDAATTVRKITLNASGAVSFTGANALTVLQIANAGVGTATFGCPVNFSGMYYVEKIGELKFPGGATAMYPDPLMRTTTSTANARTLDGTFTFTADWIVNNVGDYPWIVARNSVVRGQNFSGTQTSHHRILRVEETGYACFTTVTNGWDRGDLDIDGTLEATKEVIVRTNPTASSNESRLGREGNIGTIKAWRIAKDEHSIARSYISNFVVGAGGFGSLCKDYAWRLYIDTTITASDDFEFLGVFNSGSKADWGVWLNSDVTLTINVPAGKTVTCGAGLYGNSGGFVCKTGEGTLVMTDSFNGTSGFAKTYSKGTIIEEGTVRLAVNGQLGTGPVTIASGARLEVAGGIALSNQVDGEGTLALSDGDALTMGNIPWSVGKVEVASGATVNVTTAATGTFSFLTGVDADNLAQFSCGEDTLVVAGGVLSRTSAGAGAYVWNGASGADWSVAGNWLVGGAAPATAPASTDTIVFQNSEPITVGGTDPLSVTKIVTLSDDLVTFSCPVQFTGTYLVENAATAPLFAGGATATVADASLTDMNVSSHTLNGVITFTEDWTIPLQPAGRPFVVSENSVVTGKVLSAAEYSAGQPDLRIDAGAVATFDSVSVNRRLIVWLNGGRLVATGDVLFNGTGGGGDFGYYAQPNNGVVEAHGVYKSASGGGAITCYVTNFVVGAGGFGMLRRDYMWNFQRDTRLTATDDLTIYEPHTDAGVLDGEKDTDWGFNFNGHTFTVDTAGHTVTFDSYVRESATQIIKEGAGELIMRSRQKKHTGGTILNGGLTTVEIPGALGYGTATVNDGATLRFADMVLSFAYPIVVNAGGILENAVTIGDASTLTLTAGATLKPAQNAFFDLSSGTLVLPEEGTVSVDMTGFTFVNGVATPLLTGVAAGDEAKFSALVPAGVTGSFSVSGGVLSYTATSGGSAAADLFWHPAGDATWSTAVAAWTNAAGEQVSFAPYANATVADAATIALPADVSANDVTISTDGDVTLNGTGKLGGPGTIYKKGEGTFTFNATGGLDAQPIVVSNGVFKVGEDLVDHALGASADTSPIVVADGGTLDLNYNSSSTTDDARSKVTRDKVIHIAGDGYEGKGAVVNDNLPGYRTISNLVLDDDASVGGTVRYDVRGGLSGYVRNNGTIYGPGKTLTVKNTSAFGIVYTDVTLGSLLIADGGVVQFEGPDTYTYSISDGVHLADGKIIFYNAYPGSLPIVADSGANTISIGAGTPTIGGPITVASGATLTHASGTAVYTGAINGTLGVSGGTANLEGGVPTTGWTLNGAQGSEIVRLRQSGTYTGANINAFAFGVADVADSTVDVTFLDSTINIGALTGSSGGFYLGWGGIASGYVTIGSGTTLTTVKICVGDNGTSTSGSIKSVFTVDGGTVNLTEDLFYIAYNGPHSDFIMNSGTMNVRNAPIRLRANNQALGGGNTSRFIQNGGTFNYGGPGFQARYEDNTDEGQIVLKGGEFNATANWSIPHFISTCFKGGDANGWTLTQADGTTATWNTALTGDGDVTLNGAATLVGNKEMQGVIGGKWTVGDGFTAGLEGAASLLGGLDIGEGAKATVNIATDRSAVFTARDFGDRDLSSANSIVGRFNKKPGGTTRGTITHDETLLFTNYAQAARPFGDMNYTETYAVGHFYVEESKTGTWSFEGRCDDRVALWIDGEQVMIATADCDTVTGTKEITTAGWHTFRHVISDNSGGFGPAANHAYHTVGYKDPTMSAYARFNVKNLKMRPAADMGDANNANTVCWSHY